MRHMKHKDALLWHKRHMWLGRQICDTVSTMSQLCQPVKPQDQLLILFLVEEITVLVLSIHSFIISTQLLDSLVDLVTEWRRQRCHRRPLLQPGEDAGCDTVATEPRPRRSAGHVRERVQTEITRQRRQHLPTRTFNSTLTHTAPWLLSLTAWTQQEKIHSSLQQSKWYEPWRKHCASDVVHCEQSVPRRRIDDTAWQATHQQELTDSHWYSQTGPHTAREHHRTLSN